jgi:hypothetical protein
MELQVIKWFKSLFVKKQLLKNDFVDDQIEQMLNQARKKPKRPRLYKQATVVTIGELDK